MLAILGSTSISGLITLLITILVCVVIFALVLAFVYWLLTLLPIQQPFKNLILALVGLIGFCIILLYFVGHF
jgi:hypothetical protein